MANEYEEHAPIQKSAGDMLIALLNIGKNEDVLDLGCGVGNITRRIRKMTTGKVVGIDPSEGMIKKAREKARKSGLTSPLFFPENLPLLD